MNSTVLFEQKGPVAWVTLNRPKVLNAMSMELLRQLIATIKTIADDDRLKVMVLTGSGRAFSVGGDIKEMDGASETELAQSLLLFQQLSRNMHDLDKPIIAAVNGYALAGGFELALSCDVRIASQGAQFALPDAKIGLSPTSAMTYLLTRTIGMGRAIHLYLTGDTLTAGQAQEIGLVTRVTDQEGLLGEVEQMAQSMAKLPRLGVAYAKRLFHMAAETSFANTLVCEKEFEMHCFRSEETQRALAAFASRR
jgi:enoyl-CoA hydratase/carnithine racemase